MHVGWEEAYRIEPNAKHFRLLPWLCLGSCRFLAATREPPTSARGKQQQQQEEELVLIGVGVLFLIMMWLNLIMFQEDTGLLYSINLYH